MPERPRLSRNVIFQENFTHREGLLTNWTDADSAFSTTIRPGVVKVVSAGELVYSGTPLHIPLGTEESSETDADWAVRVVLRGTDNLKLTVRARRQDANNSIGFSVDFETNVANLIRRVAGVDTVVQQQSHQFRSDGFNTYVIGLWMQGANIRGFVNHFDMISFEDSSFRAEQGFSIYIPEIDQLDPPKLYSVYVHRLNPQNSPQIDDPSNLLVTGRLLTKEAIENPATLDWTTFKHAYALWLRDKDQGFTNEQWEELGYPLHRPTAEEWFGNE